MSEETRETKPMTRQRLIEIEQRAANATPGPWNRLGGSGRASALVSTEDDSGPDIAEIFGPHEPPNANAEFIAAARTDVPDLLAEIRRLRARDIEREAWALRLLADAGDPVARAVVNAPVVPGKPDPNEPPIEDLRPEDCVPHEVVLQQLLDRAAQEHEALTAEIARLRQRDAAWQRATRVDDPTGVGQRNVCLCSCDGAILPQIGDEVDTCWTCDGIVKVPEDGEGDR